MAGAVAFDNHPPDPVLDHLDTIISECAGHDLIEAADILDLLLDLRLVVTNNQEEV